jgi:hypothetical protein
MAPAKASSANVVTTIADTMNFWPTVLCNTVPLCCPIVNMKLSITENLAYVRLYTSGRRFDLVVRAVCWHAVDLSSNPLDLNVCPCAVNIFVYVENVKTCTGRTTPIIYRLH